MLINSNKSLNYSKKSRKLRNIEFLIIHYTGMQSTRASLQRLKNPKSKVSCHYFITKNGVIYRMVEDNKVAWHAGKSKWMNKTNLNKYSLGIEIQNKGHQFGYEKFTKKQISALIQLLKILVKKYKIKKNNILGHSDIAPLRKIDPGENFPWKLLSKKGLALWYKNFKFKKNSNKSKIKRKIFFRNIHKIGYRFFNSSKKSKNDNMVIKSFQRRFLPRDISGKITYKTFKISQLLARKSNLT